MNALDFLTLSERLARAGVTTDAPVSLPCAHRNLWPHIHAAFQRGFDTLQIAEGLGVTEAEVANALHRIREQARAA